MSAPTESTYPTEKAPLAPAERNFTFRDWIPRVWVDNRVFVLVSVYRSFRVRFPAAPSNLSSSIPGFEGLHIVLFRGEFSYQVPSALEFIESNEGDVRALSGTVNRCSATNGSYTAVFVPFDGTPMGEQIARERTAVACGVTRAELGFNAAHSLVHRFVLTPDGAEQILGKVVRAPDTDVWIDVSAPDSQWGNMMAALYALPTDERRICELAFRWASDAQQSTGVDALLKAWIAIETLAMRDSTNIKPLNQLLGSAYGIESRDVNMKLGTGLLLGLRSLIVHKGATFPVHFSLEDHAQALFRDLSRARLGLSCRRFAEATAAEAVPRLRELTTQLDT